jgi:hypothetical protein
MHRSRAEPLQCRIRSSDLRLDAVQAEGDLRLGRREPARLAVPAAAEKLEAATHESLVAGAMQGYQCHGCRLRVSG